MPTKAARQTRIEQRHAEILEAKAQYLAGDDTKLKSRLPTLWTNSYFVSTIGGAPLEGVKQYIEQQKHT